MASSTLVPETVPAAAPSPWEARLYRAFFAPVNIGPLVFFRVAFGAIMIVEAYRYLSQGWVERNYVNPDFHFPYFGFSWVQAWPGDGMYYSFYAMGALAFLIGIGFLYRAATILFFLNFAHIFLCDQTYYLNHFYLVTLVSGVMCIVPANRAWSVDVLIRPKLYSPTVPVWTLRLILFHVFLAYFFGGVAKIDSDWLHGDPMRATLSNRTSFPLIGRWFHEEWMVHIFSTGGMLFDLLIVPALLWPRTRMAAFFVAVLFHVTNAILFHIGIFPWFMIAATMLFFPPDWFRLAKTAPKPEETGPQTLSAGQKAIAGLLGLYVAVHLLLPLRHFLYPGNASWTEEGNFFAWRMMLSSKTGDCRFFAVTEDGRRLPESTLLGHTSTEQVRRILKRKSLWQGRFSRRDNLYLTPLQRKRMPACPEMMLHYAHFLASEFQKAGYGDVAIYCKSRCSLNGRPRQALVDPEVDLAKVEASLRPASWIMPLEHPLPGRESRRPTGRDDDDDAREPPDSEVE